MMTALAAMDGGVTTALGGVLLRKTPRLKIIMDDDFKPGAIEILPIMGDNNR